MKDFYFLKNNLFTTYTLEVDFKNIYDFNQDLSHIFNQISSLYDKKKFLNINENQLEAEFIAKVLEILGWQYIAQEEKVIQGKLEKPDFILFATQQAKEAYLKIPTKDRYSSTQGISVISESKAYNIEIDNKKVEGNPHLQIFRYLNSLKIDFGFLSNAKLWRFYDNSKLYATKTFYEINLEVIIENNDLEAFKYFYFIFNVDNFTSNKNTTNPVLETLSKNTQSKIAIEDDLKSIIYGINQQNSVFEKIGSCIYAKNHISPKDVYENTLYFTFRLLFIAYFEDKFDDILQTHQYFKNKISLQSLFKNLDDKEDDFSGFVKLQEIFKIYDKGQPSYDMPIFNGGLFDEDKTKPLNTPKLFSNKDLKEILEKFFYFKSPDGLFKRDYRTLSISHLGTIYEGLLTYFFEIAQEDIFYIEYSAKKSVKSSVIEGYFDSYDYEKIKKSSIIHKVQSYQKNQIYLKNTSNSRKNTASYYTPESIVSYLVKESLKNKITPENILSFKILDNSCGSGHFLVEALNWVTLEVLQNFEAYLELKKIYEIEKQTINNNTAQYIKNYHIDESDILKRLLLKRMIFGVDLNPFSIELTKLSLWINSFIFGTPLSFIEHHIKCGNALIGTSIQKFEEFYFASNKKEMSLWMNNFQKKFTDLSDVFKKIDSLKDTTEEEILESKRIYKEEITPTLEELNLYLDSLNVLKFLDSEEKRLFDTKTKPDIEELFKKTEIKKIIQKYVSKYKFFNYEIQFPEIRQNSKFQGFQVIIGNPPWDKTKFSEADFYPQYKSDYRTLSNNEKKELRIDLLTKPAIKALHDEQKQYSEKTTYYYKFRYPLNKGSGDINLFKLFIEHNLSLLQNNATLNYVLPSALMFEEGSYLLRKHILEEKQLEFFYSFENNEGIFHDIHRRYKFALMQIKNMTPPPNHTIKTMFYQTNLDALYNKKNIIPLDINLIRSLSPDHLSLMELRDTKDLSLLKKCYLKFPALSLEWLDFRRELDMTGDKGLFIESFKEGLIPLYEGKMIHQFDSDFSKPKYFLNIQKFDKNLKSKEVYRLKQDLGLNKKQYKSFIKINNLNEDDFIHYDREFFRLCFRAIASDTNERTLIFSLLPRNIGGGNSIWTHIPKQYCFDNQNIAIKPIPTIRLLFALGIFNSLVVDFIARQMIQINVNKTYLERLPIPQPSDEELTQNKIYHQIALNALKLQLYKNYEDFKELANEFHIQDIPTTQKSYDYLRAQNDIAIAKLYKISYEEFCYLLESFRVFCSKQPQYIVLLKSLQLWE